ERDERKGAKSCRNQPRRHRPGAHRDCKTLGSRGQRPRKPQNRDRSIMIFPRPVRILLYPLSVLYGVVVRVRAQLYAKGWLKPRRLNGTVISVGNLTVGGTGKTPVVIWLAEKFLSEGKRSEERRVGKGWRERTWTAR